MSSTLLWCCSFFNFTQSVILENFSILDLELSGVKYLHEITCLMKLVTQFLVTRSVNMNISFPAEDEKGSEVDNKTFEIELLSFCMLERSDKRRKPENTVRYYPTHLSFRTL